MPVSVIGINIAKNVFQVHGVDDAGRPLLLKQL
jgi:transposase